MSRNDRPTTVPIKLETFEIFENETEDNFFLPRYK